MAFEIEQVIVRVIRLPLIEPFKVSFGTVKERDQIIVEVVGQGISGWGECAVLPFPYYNHETAQTALHILSDFAIPILFRSKSKSPVDLHEALDVIVGNRIARSGLDMAYWDWVAKSKGLPLYTILGGKRSEIPVGISVPLYDDTEVLLDRIGAFLEKKYHKIKIKIAPSQDINLIEAIVKRFGEIPLMVDANSAYSLEDIDLFKRMDEYNLMMIEQPLEEDDIYNHSKLQRAIRNPICLDESIEHVRDTATAIELGSCKIINIKPGRVGGLTESKAIHDLAAKHGVGVWCGGMLETGIGRAINMSIATLPNYIYPGDIGESSRYYHEDIVSPEIKLTASGTLKLLDKPGIGFSVNKEALDKFTSHKAVFNSRDL